MKQSIYISMIDGVTMARSDPCQLTVTVDSSVSIWRPYIVFKNVTDGLCDLLSQIQKAPRPIPELFGKAMQSDGFPGISKLRHYLERLGQYGMLVHHLITGETQFASIYPLTVYFRYEQNRVKRDSHYTLSRFAYCRNKDGQMTINSPLSCAKILLHHPDAITALYRLAVPVTPAQLAETVSGLDEEDATSFMNFLANAGALQALERPGYRPEKDDPALGQWAFHDLLFHANSRLGRHADPYGGTFPFKDKFAPLPVVKEGMSGEIVPLFKPDMERLMEEEAPFSMVLEKRQSIRRYGNEPVHADQLGEFLYRCYRIKKMVEEGGVSWRPSPGGGAIHELEIYAAVNRCQGLPFGVYHYNPLKHQLCRINTAPESLVAKLLEMSRITGKLEQPAHVLLVITARFQRVQMKYQSVAYSVMLKDVGCLYQTMYLVATAMDLAPCALGGGDSELFAQISGLDYYQETSVGEFLLGSAPEIKPEPLERPKENA